MQASNPKTYILNGNQIKRDAQPTYTLNNPSPTPTIYELE